MTTNTDVLAEQMTAAAEEWYVIDEDVREAMRTVRRDMFAPGQFRIGGELFDRAKNPDEWLKAVYSPEPLVTRYVVSSAGQEVATSSLSAPSIVLQMLYDAAISPGDKVFEAGTGSGWTAALMSSWVGAQYVTTIEFDPVIAAVAVENLSKAGFAPTTLTGDATSGYPANAPYDRAIWTCAVDRVPFTMVEQTRVGGLIVVPWQSPFGRQAVVRLRVVEPGLAMGNFTSLCGFMLSRARKAQPSTPEVFTPRDRSGGRSGRTRLDHSELFTYSQRAWALSYRMGDPGAYRVSEAADPGLWLHDGQSDSWSFTNEQGNVWQGGPRSLWTELEEAVAWYEAAGEPGVTRFGMTVAKDGETVWLDHPGNVLLAQGKASEQRPA